MTGPVVVHGNGFSKSECRHDPKDASRSKATVAVLGMK